MNNDTLPSESYFLKHVLTVVCLIGFAVVTHYMLSVTPADTDIHGHVTYGLEMIDSGQIPSTDLYSYTAKDQPWINHEWLSEITFAVAFRLGSFQGLHLLRVLVFLTLVLTFLWYWQGIVELRLLHYYPALLLTASAFLLIPFFMVRPQLFSFLFFVVSLFLYQQSTEGSSWVVFVFIPLMILWCNFHGGFVVGLGLLVFFTLTSYFVPDQSIAKWFAITLLSTLGTLLNPYGIGLHRQISSSLTNPLTPAMIQDWQPLWETNFFGIVCLTLTPVVILLQIAACYWGNKHRNIFIHLIISLACFVTGLLTVRNLAFFALSQPFFWGPWFKENRNVAKRDSVTQPALMIAIVSFAILGFGIQGEFDQNPVNQFPEETVMFIQQENLRGNLATPFKWGQYCIFHLHPEINVSMDGRYDTVYPESVITDFVLRIYRAREGWLQRLRDYKTDYLLVTAGSPLHKAANRKGLERMFKGTTGVLYSIQSPAVQNNQ